jgi:hypothetical protein
MRAILGLEADLGHGTLLVAPAFPEWLWRVRIDDLQALGRRFDLEVARDATGYQVTSDGPVEVKETRMTE